MRSFQQRLPDFDARGVRVVGISVDPPDVNVEHRRKLGVTFPLLSDETGEVTRRFNLLHPKGSPGGADISRPAEFLVDASGTVRWANVTQSLIVRATPEEVLKAIDGMPRAAPVNVR